MALSRCLFVVLIGAALLSLSYRAIAAGEVGVNYGTLVTDLTQVDQAQVAKLLKDTGITKVRIYDTNAEVLKALANTGIKVQVTMPNDQIADAAASDGAFARQWVQSQVAAYLPDTMIEGVAVGNEVFKSPNAAELNPKLVPAMRNVHDALRDMGLDGAVKVTTPVAFDALEESSPPSAGRFRDEVAPVMKDLLGFVQQTDSSLTANIYPFFAYASDPRINLDYALGNPQAPGFQDSNTGLMYSNLLDAQIDAMYYAIDALGSDAAVSETQAAAAGAQPPRRSTYLTESGWPSGGAVHPTRVQGRRRLLDTGDGPASIANAQAFNNNLINRILSGNTGTPYRPDADLGAYIFALFNEDKKGTPDDVETHFGLFYPNMTKVYPFSFVK